MTETPMVTEEQEKRFLDWQYEYIQCETCGERHQRIDFFGNPHAFFCADPKSAKFSIPVNLNEERPR
jgi:hypothetical protein